MRYVIYKNIKIKRLDNAEKKNSTRPITTNNNKYKK